MKKLLFLLSIFAVHRASALPAFDPFADASATNGATTYTVGSSLLSQTNALLQNWAAIGTQFTGPQPLIASGSLSYPGLPSSTGNSVAFFTAPTTGMGARLNLQTNGTSGAFYYSYLLQITNIDAVPTTPVNNGFAGFSDGPAAQPQQLARLGTRVLTLQTNGGFVIGLGRNNTLADYVYDTNVHALNEVVFIVGSYELVGGVTNVNLWINPATNTFGLTNVPPPTLSVPTYTTTTGALNSSGVAAFVINCQYTTAPSGIIDELRVEKSWKYVTGGDPSQPVAISVQPSPRIVVAGNKAAFGVEVSGTSPTFQWLSNGLPISGATQFGYTITNAQASDQANYSVIVSNFLNSSVTSAPATLTVLASTPRIYSTNLVVIRVGSGAQTPSVNGNSMYLDQFTTSGSYLSTLNIPDDGSTAMTAMGPNITGSSLTGSCLTRSSDQRLLVVGGYNTNLAYGANLRNSLSSVVPRGMAVIDTFGQYTLAVSNTDDAVYSGQFWRGGITDNGTNFWGAASGTLGTYYFGFDAAPATIQAQFGNVRSIATFNGNIYCVSAVSGNNGVLKMDGLPKTAVTPTVLFPGSTSSSDLEVSANGNLIYVADDRNTPNGGVQRWEYDGSIWTLAYTLTNGLPNGAQYMTANFAGPNPVVYAVTAGESNNRLIAISDTGAASTSTTLAFAGANQTFRGIRFGPTENAVVLQPTLLLTRDGDNITLSWNGAFTLQSATNVAGAYSDVSGATSPFTTNVTSQAQQFFRLHN